MNYKKYISSILRQIKNTLRYIVNAFKRIKIFYVLKFIFLASWYIFQRVFLLAFISAWFLLSFWWLSHEPSLYRDWEDQDTLLAEIIWQEGSDEVEISNIRNHEWLSDSEFIP